MTVLTVSRFPSCRVYATRGNTRKYGLAEAVQYIDFSSTGVERIGFVVRVQSSVK